MTANQLEKFKPQAAEEFVVEEICSNGKVLEIEGHFSEADFQDSKKVRGAEGRGKFAWFVLQKTNWNTPEALAELAARLRMARTRFDCAGNKDRTAISTQLCSCFAGDPAKLMDERNWPKDVKVLGAWRGWDKVKMGFLAGNRFTIALTKDNCGLEPEEALERIEKKIAEGHLEKMPNFFGSQRFGSVRRNTAEVGELLLKGDWESAAMNYLSFSDENERDEESKEARQRLAQEKDFKKALEYFPRHLKFERTILGHLAITPTDFAGALRKLPRSLELLFIHAFQAKLFNELLEKRVAEGRLGEKTGFSCPANALGFPDADTVKKSGGAAGEGKSGEEEFVCANIIGYESDLTGEEEELLAVHGIEKTVFLLKGMPELSSKGALRPVEVPLKDFKVLEQPGSGNGPGAGNGPDAGNGSEAGHCLKIRFSLPSGAYATVAVDWLLGA